MHRRYVVSGRVTRRDTGEGVHGLQLEVWADAEPCDKCVDSALTNRDGSYRIEVRDEDLPESAASDPVLFVKVRDRECRIIHDTSSTMSRCDPQQQLVVDLALVPDILWWHLSRPLSWEPPNGPLVPADVVDEIREAVGLVSPPGTPDHSARLRAAMCSFPPVDAFDNLLNDAWSTLQGDLDAAARLQDVLQALCAEVSCDCCDTPASHAETVDRIFSEAAKHECHGCAPCPSPDDPCLHDRGDCGCHRCNPVEPPCPCRATFATTDKALILIMAALHVSCGHATTAKTYVLALLDQLCRFELAGALHRSAGRALCGDSGSREHFRDLLEFAAARCGAGPAGRTREYLARDPQCCCSTCLDCELERCLQDAVSAWHCIRCYSICEIHPPRACPGDEIVIRGCGFGGREGQVMFREHGTVGPGPVANPTRWCDDEIRVIVPEGAGCGLVIQPPTETVRICDRFVELRPHGCAEASFEGTSPEVLRFAVEGRSGGECLEPGEPLLIRWRTCAVDRVRVEIVDEETNGVIAALNPAPATGRWDFTATNFTSTRSVQVKLTAEGTCEPRKVSRQISFVFQARPALAVIGTEVTQGIQYHRAPQHLTDPADRGPDNSLRLVTNKTAWVRAYLRSGQDPAFGGGQLPGVDGTLTVERRVGGVWGVVASIPSQNGPVTAEDSFVSYDAERGNIDASLNFVVPAGVMTGLLRFTVDAASDLPQCPGNQASGAPVVCDVNLTQTLNAAFITIAYNGPDAAGTGTLNLPAPTLAQCQAETSWAMTTYPVSGQANVRIAGTFTTTTPLNDPRSCPGCCSPNWGPLLQTVANLVAADQAANPGATWAYYGIVAGGIPVNVPGCNGVATGGLAGQPVTYAHEIGHQFGLPHARCGNAGAGNAAYPVYEPYDFPADPPGTTNWTMASTGEYGLDINNGAIANPNTAEDFMSYCGPPWMSIFTHNFLVNAAGLVPQTIPTGSGAATERVIQDLDPGFTRSPEPIEPLIHMLGRVDENGAVEVTSLTRVETRYSIGRGVQTDYVAQLMSENGEVIAQDRLYRYDAAGCDCGKPCGCCDDQGRERSFAFKVMLDDHAPGERLRIVRSDEVVWERSSPDNSPVLSKATAKLSEKGLQLKWRFRKATRSVEDVWIRWSNDEEGTWRALAVGITGTSADISPDQLPAGEVCFQILAHDGFSTTSITTEVVQLPAKPPVATILYPKTGDTAYAERQLHLWGTATSSYQGSIPEEQFVWYIDGREVGRGSDIWVDSPEPGRHQLRLEVSDEGGTGSDASEPEALPPPNAVIQSAG